MKKKIRKAIIPAAGLGTRFLPATKAIPKEMLPIVDKPMIQWIVEEAVAAGIEDIVLITARNKEAIEDHFDYSYEVEDVMDRKGKTELAELSRQAARLCNIISVRQKNPMGLGHAILCAESVIGDEPFAVLLGDDLIDSRIPCVKQLVQQYYKGRKNVVGVMEVEPTETTKYGIVVPKISKVKTKLFSISGMVEKPAVGQAPSSWAVPGRYVFGPEIFDAIRKCKADKTGEIQLTAAIDMLAKKGRMNAFAFTGRRFDTGDRAGFIEANVAYALKRPDLAAKIRKMVKEFAREAT